MVKPGTRIGRYEVVGQLALGGMAEILLGRLLGPSGFERVVVIKRVLPHLSQHASFTAMFLDEARIAAAIRHPNVVPVYELGNENDTLFLVMEYLEGESLHGLLRRLTMLGERLDPALAAHVAAQACAGLHAAHELPDAEGRPTGVVHRDISPQNVFISYDGAVKILDFGIAKAADRITQTEAGTLKGKFAYMSPEQCMGEPLDRRSDLFSLGIVLYEMVTGRRLFHRAAQLQTLNAVVQEPFPAPSILRPGLPGPLEEVVLRALDRDRDARFQTAADMRRALALAGSAIGGPVLPEEALAELMQRLFPDRIREKTEMLRGVRAGTASVHVPAADIDVHVELPTIPSAHVAPKHARLASRPAPARSRGAWVLAAALAGLFAGGFALWRGASSSEVAAASVPSALSSSAPSTSSPSSPSSASRAPATPAPTSAPVPSAGPEEISLQVTSEPSGALVALGERELGPTPLDVHLERTDTPVTLHVRRGTLEHVQTLVPDRDLHVQVILAERASGERASGERASAERASNERASSRRARSPAPPAGESAPPAAPEPGFGRFD